MSMFECLKCGACCRKLLHNMGQWTVGLFLLPTEMKLFPEDHLAPMWGIGLKGRSRPRPESLAVIQLDTQPCPHINPDNKCGIYLKRPQICRAHPLSVTITEGMIISASTSTECKATEKIPRDQKVTLSNYFTEEILHANAVISSYLDVMFKQSAGMLWLFDLESKKWKRVTYNSYPKSK